MHFTFLFYNLKIMYFDVKLKNEYRKKIRELKKVYSIKTNNWVIHKIIDLELQRFWIKL